GRKDGHRQLSFLKPMGQERAARHAPHHSCAIRQTPQAIPTTPSQLPGPLARHHIRLDQSLLLPPPKPPRTFIFSL
ncbi:MAG: hypothetical protein WA733_22660, partial [Methylocystis sp.]